MNAAYDPSDEDLGKWFEELYAWDEREDTPGPVLGHRTVSYGNSDDQTIDVWTPDQVRSELVVVTIHGGFFAEEYTREVNAPLSRAIARRGYEVWNIEYRRARPGSGGFTQTTSDVRSAVELAAASRPGRLAIVGHSAGGYLAEWSAALDVVDLVIVVGGVTDLEDSARSGRDEGSIAAWLGGAPGMAPARYAEARLQPRLPAHARHVLLHGAEDQTVPLAQSCSYAAAIALAGEDVSLHVLPETGHYAFIDPREPAFERLVDVLASEASH